jgi:hypothetical protein
MSNEEVVCDIPTRTEKLEKESYPGQASQVYLLLPGVFRGVSDASRPGLSGLLKQGSKCGSGTRSPFFQRLISLASVP